MDRRSLGLGLLLVMVTGLVGSASRADEVSVGFFVRGDTDHTTVLSPRAAVAAQLDGEETRLDVAYTADIWTSASIDVRTAATHAITEQRDQIDGAISHTMRNLTFGASYYFSGENDYMANGGSLSASQELAQKNTTIEERLTFSYDIAGRAGDPSFARGLATLGGRLVLTQVIDPETIIQGAFEIAHREGYQSNPYRFVGMGGDGQCAGTAAICVPEAHPTLRTRNSFVTQVRRALSDDSSLGVGYRFYFDDWGVTSHTAIAQIAWLPTEESTVTLRYRFYLQEAANFYRSVYPNPGAGIVQFVTRDRELSPLFSNRVALAYETNLPLGIEDLELEIGIAVAGTVFVYRDFVGLDEVYSGDASVALTLEL